MNDVNSYVDYTDDPDDRGSLSFYAEIISRKVDGNAQVTKPINPKEPEDFVQIIPEIDYANPIEKNSNQEDYTVRVANTSITMSSTNWLLALIAFILFLILILK